MGGATEIILTNRRAESVMGGATDIVLTNRSAEIIEVEALSSSSINDSAGLTVGGETDAVCTRGGIINGYGEIGPVGWFVIRPRPSMDRIGSSRIFHNPFHT